MRRLVSTLTVLVLTTTVLLITAPAEAGTRYVVTARASTAKLDVGQSFTLRGRVRPKARGQRVKIQLLTAGRWTTIKKARLNRRSKYKATIRVTSPGDNLYRVVKPRSNGHKKGVSPTVTVVGWRWRSLLTLPHDTPTNLDEPTATHEAATIASVTLRELVFRPALKLGSASVAGSAWATYRLDGKCAEFDSHVGVTADSAPFATNYFDVGFNEVGGNDDYDFTGEQVTTRGDDPAHVYRGPTTMLNLDGIGLFTDTAAAGDYTAWGNPRVYCRS